MKKIKNILSATIVLFSIAFILNSCESDQIETNVESANLQAKTQIDEVTKIDNLLSNLKTEINNSSRKLGDFEAITFELVRNNDTGEITIQNLKAEAYFPIDNPPVKLLAGYTVDCDLGGDGSDNWSESCSGAVGCAKLAKKCLDAGGCATVCNAEKTNGNFNSVKMTYLGNLK